jgi:hypothetical protein
LKNVLRIASVVCVLSLAFQPHSFARFGWGSGFDQGDLDIKKNALVLSEREENSIPPAEDGIKIFAKDDAGTTKLYTIDFAGAVQELGAGGSVDGSGTTNEIAYWVDADTLGALAVATYPSLTELSYVKGVTSAIQTQLGTKLANIIEDTSPQLGGDLDANGFDIQFDNATGIRDDSDNELLMFGKTASAVNYAYINNAATEGYPAIGVSGSDNEVGLGIRTRTSGAEGVRWNFAPSGDFVPRSDSAFNIGSDTIAVQNLYVDAIELGHATDTTLARVSAGVISVEGVQLATTSQLHDAVTVSDSSEIDFTLTGQQISASLVAGSIDESKLDTSVNASLDLADSALQSFTELDPKVGTLTSGNFCKGTGTQVSCTDANTYLTSYTETDSVVGAINGIVKANGAGTISAASAGTDYVAPNAGITGATKTKITYDAKGLVTAGADATTADINDSSNRRYVTDAQLTVIGNTSGTNTGDQVLPTRDSLGLDTDDTVTFANLSGTNTGDQTTITGNAGTATALAANGANCSAGSYPLGVNASGAVEDCTDATTEIASLIATHASDADAHQDLVTLAGTPDYITISGQVITRNAIDLATDTTGVLARSGINWDSFWLDSASSINWNVIPGALADKVLTLTTSGVNWQAPASGGLSNIVEDTTPQLGGTLDAENRDINDVKNLILKGTVVGTSGDGVIAIYNGTIPSTSITDGVQLYSQDVAVTTTRESQTTKSSKNIEIMSNIASSERGGGAVFSAAASYSLYSTTFALLRIGSPTGNVRAAVYAISAGIPTGAALATSPDLNVATISTSVTDYEFVFSSPPSLTNGTSYATVLEMNGAYTGDGSNRFDIYGVNSGSTSVKKSNTNVWTAGVNLVYFINKSATNSAEFRVRDEAGNITTLSPHNFKNIPDAVREKNLQDSNGLAWSYYSEKDGKSINVDMFRAVQVLEKLSGEQLIFTSGTEIVNDKKTFKEILEKESKL